MPGRVFFSGVHKTLGTILGRFSMIYFRGLWLRVRVRVRYIGQVSVTYATMVALLN